MKKIFLLSVLIYSTTSLAAWYRGNTHAHTILSGHGDATPLEVAQWYHDHGYHFVVLSEHNNFIDPMTVKIKNQREDFVLLPGVEVTGSQNIHTTALNVKAIVPFKTEAKVPREILKEHVARIKALGGEAISNHPNWQWALTSSDLFYVQDLRLFELFNGHPDTNVYGDAKRPSTEAIWDDMLSKGKKIFAVSSDDAHHFHTHSHDLSNPGRGWIMVKAEKLTPESLVKAMVEGNFYATSGVILDTVGAGPTAYVVNVDVEATRKSIADGKHMVGHATKRKEGIVVEFIGFGGKVLHMEELSAEKPMTSISFAENASPYIRAKVIHTVKGPNGNISFYAWGQPWWK